ncbi:MAG: hypothetical protein V4576_00145 [Patescibacteria group bacterium]
MNSIKKYISIAFLILVLGAGSFGVYMINQYVFNFSERVVEINTKLQTLEATKANMELFTKFLSKGSDEQKQINAYILSGDDVFNAITAIEKDGKKAGMFTGENLGISSVAKRENVTLKKINAGEVVVNMIVEGKTDDVDLYIKALNNLPYVSYIEKVNLTFTDNKARTRAGITLIMTEIL